ncbi:MAG: hypothetical protein ABI083_17900 [Lapillicoccus sp.]
MAGVLALGVLAACGSGDGPGVPAYTATAHVGSVDGGPATTGSAPPSASTSARSTPEPVPTTFSASQSSFTLPAASDTPTVEMLRAYVSFEDAFRRSQLTTTPDPAIQKYAIGPALTTVTTTLTYLHDHQTTQQGPWRFHVTQARASGTNGIIDVCVGGGTYTEQGTTTPDTSTTSIRVTLNNASGGWLVTGYDQCKETCS